MDLLRVPRHQGVLAITPQYQQFIGLQILYSFSEHVIHILALDLALHDGCQVHELILRGGNLLSGQLFGLLFWLETSGHDLL